MRRLLAAAVIVALVSGCSAFARRHRVPAALADAGAVAGAYLFATNYSCDRESGGLVSALDCAGTGAAAGVGVSLLVISATVGIVILANQPDDPPERRGPEVVVEPAPFLPPLPEGHADAETMRMARQARRATAAGDCAAARASLGAVARRDAAYHAALVESDAVAACR